MDTDLSDITTKHIYFAGPRMSCRIPHEEIVAFKDHSNALGITHETFNAMPRIFGNVGGPDFDGWFAYNLITSVAHWSSER